MKGEISTELTCFFAPYRILKHHSLPHCAADQIIQIMKLVTCSERGVVTCSESGVATCAEKGGSGPQSKVCN